MKPSLENLRKQAKNLQKLWESGDREALARIRAAHPQYAKFPDEQLRAARPKLTNCQFVLAREAGFASWPEMQVALHQAGRELAYQFVDLGCLCFDDPHYDHRSFHTRANEMLRENPELSEATIWSAAAAGNVAAVKKFLDRRPDLVSSPGPHGWAPLICAAYSRVQALDPAHSTFDVAQVLLDRGADPDAFTMKGNSDQRLDQTKRRFTALAGLFGGGSTGFANQPRHPRWREFAELLLSRGAGPADAQALKLGHQDCLEIALRYGLRDADLLQRELAWAVWRGNIQMVKLLLAHHAPAGDLWEKAMERGDGDIARLLEEAGAPTAPLTAVQQFVSFCMRGDASAARAMLDEEPSLRVAARQDLVRRAVETGRKEAVNLVIDLGFDPNFVDDNAAIHAAAGAGNEEMVRLLLARGASVTLRDPWYGSTAVGWADFFDRRELRDMLLKEAPICLQDAIDFGREDRAEEIRKRDAESELKPET